MSLRVFKEATRADRMLKGHEAAFTVKADFGDGLAEYPVWQLMERLLWITDKDTNKVRFILNYQQILLYLEMARQKESGRPVRQNVLKARQLGYSTFIAGFGFIMAMFTPNYRLAVMADIRDHAANIFSKYVYFYDHLDDSNPHYEEIAEFERTHPGRRSTLSWKPKLAASRDGRYMRTEAGNSTLEVIVAGEGSGRSGTYTMLPLSECAFFDNLKDTMKGALSTVYSKAINSLIFLETTANGFNEYKRRWDADVADGDSWHAFFMPWFENPDYSKELLPGQSMPILPDWMAERQKAHGLSDEQMNWYYEMYRGFGADKESVLQEYPFTQVDAFISTGDCIFGADLVAKRKAEIAAAMDAGTLYKRRGMFSYQRHFSDDGSMISLSDVRFNDLPSGSIRVFELPQKGHPYVAVCDPNNETNDDSAIQVIDNSNCHQVACFSRSDLQWDEVAYQLYCLARWYNGALISNEMNLGKTVMDYVRKLGYQKIYVRMNAEVDDFHRTVGRSYGHIITKGNRQMLLEELKILFRQDPLCVSDYETICEMETFQSISHVSRTGAVRKKDEAAPGEHDDLVMAFVGFFAVRDQQTAVIRKEDAPSEEDGMTYAQALAYVRNARRASNRGETAFERATGMDFSTGFGG